MDKQKQIAVVIPSLEPDEHFCSYLQSLKDAGISNIIIVDDGNKTVYQKYFQETEAENCEVLHHGVNCGKGRALKTAFNDILVNHPDIDVIVTADQDGTYLAEDVLKTAQNAQENTIVLGCRDFRDPCISGKSRYTNAVTRFLMNVLGGIQLSDTQTGLRAYTRDILPYLITVPGERYEYDFNVIVDKKVIELKEVPITPTVRMSDRASHFRPIADSWNLIRSFLTFIMTSLSATIVDVVVYSILIPLLINAMPILYITVATVIARLISDSLMYMMDKYVVFKAGDNAHIERYLILILVKMLLSALLVTLMVFIFKDGETTIKLVVDTILFFVGYRFEKNWVYAK